MGNGYPIIQPDAWQQFVADLKELFRRVRELERPTGTQIFGAVAKVKEAIDSIGTLVDAYLATGFTTGSMTATGDVNVGGFVFSPQGRSTTVVTSVASAWFDGTGKLGINPSTVEGKQDFEPADTSAEVDALLHMALIKFRRVELVEMLGDDAPWELGSIVEYLAQTALVDATFNDLEGKPLGIEWSQLVKPLIATVQSLDARLKAAGL